MASDDLPEALRLLTEGETAQRRAAAQRLGSGPGGAAVEPLCRALRDPDFEVRIRAVEALGQLGDVRAVAPLAHALQRCTATPWAVLNAAGGLSWAVCLILGAAFALGLLCVTLEALFLQGTIEGIIVGLGSGTILAWTLTVLREMVIGPAQRNRMCDAVAHSLYRISEGKHAPELREALPALRAVVSDLTQKRAETRAASRAVARRIETLTRHLKDLPVPGTAPAAAPERLPRPCSNDGLADAA